jgi:micrococcal nuclease
MSPSRRLALVLACLFLLSGCLGSVADGSTRTPVVPETPPPGASVSRCPEDLPPSPEAGDGERTELPDDALVATVVEVVDGDTITLRFANGACDRARLLGVDTPETYAENEPEEYEGVPATDLGRRCLDAWGRAATNFTTRVLLGERVTVAFDPNEPRRDRYDRLLVYVDRDASPPSFDYRLVAEGYARVYDSEFVRRESFYAAEARAQDARRGLWTCRNPEEGLAAAETGATTPVPDGGTANGGETAGDVPLVVSEIRADAPGNDNENPNGEYVVFRNSGDDPLDLSGWTVADGAGHEYAFPDGFVLGAGETVRLYTGSGENTQTALYWGQDGAVWNNGGDVVIVRDAEGTVVLRDEY